MPGYGGILSGLVQGYAGGVLQKEQREYEAKQKEKQDRLKMYQVILDSPDADPSTKQAAWQQIEDTLHGGGNGKKSQGPGLLSKIGGLLTGHAAGGDQPMSEKPPQQQSPEPQGLPRPPQQPSGGGMQPPPTGFKPHFYAPEEKQAQQMKGLEAQEELKMKYWKQQEEVQQKNALELEKAREAGRIYKTPVGPKPGGMPWETGQTISRGDGTQEWVATNPPKDVADVHQMAESLSRSNGKSVLENYDAIWTMKAQGLELDQIKKQLGNANTQSQINSRDTASARAGYVKVQDANGEWQWIKKPEVGSRFGSLNVGQQPGQMSPPPQKDGASAPPAAAPPVIDTGVQGKMPKGKATGAGGGNGGVTRTQKTALDAAEKKKNEDLLKLHERSSERARKAATQQERDAIWREEKGLQEQIQQNYRSQRQQVLGSPPPQKNGGNALPTGHKVGDPVQLKNGKKGKITKIYPDGSFDYE